ncbi:hypothetical protein MJT46_001167 [Ovis ammon polii x Ovis aries]|nr:hypothetical protein MJT46_001167 [Ovis ammon polii x Ovis aries]
MEVTVEAGKSERNQDRKTYTFKWAKLEVTNSLNTHKELLFPIAIHRKLTQSSKDILAISGNAILTNQNGLDVLEEVKEL